MSARTAALWRLLDSAALARVYALAAFGTAFGSFAIERMMSHVTLVTMVTGLCLLGLAILIVRRAELSLLRTVPTSLVLFVVWAGVTLIMPGRSGTSFASWLALVGFAFIAVVIAHTRDTLQTVRALGDVLRWLLLASLGVEILSGVLLDMPFPFLGVEGAIANLGPIQGIFGTRNMLGFVAVIALLTFVIELRTHSIDRALGVGSIVLAGLLAALSSSPTVLVLAAATAVATGALAIVRHTPAERRRTVQFTLAGVVIAGLAALFLARHWIIALLDAGSDISMRVELWNTITDVYVPLRPWQGYGWRGPWIVGGESAFPYTAINITGDRHGSALNAYVDILLQLGALGLALFVLACGAALVRSWFVASERRSVLYAWTPLVLVTLLTDSVVESFTLAGVGWMLLVLCVVRAGQARSWRELVDAARTPEPHGDAR